MNAYQMESKRTLEIVEAIKTYKNHFCNKRLNYLHQKAKKSILLEMDDLYLLENPFYEKYSFLGVFRVNLNDWSENSMPLTQLGLYNAFRDRVVSSSHFYDGELKKEISKFQSENSASLIETFYNEDYDLINYDEYKELIKIDRVAHKIKDLRLNNITNLTIENKKTKHRDINPVINPIDLLKIISKLLSDKNVSIPVLNEQIIKSINKMENQLSSFKEDENNSYCIEKQWCVRIYGALEKGTSYAKWFAEKKDAYNFYNEMIKSASMRKVQSNMFCVIP